ncbi:MAG: O-antigen ligase family protein [Crocinitomicaceae bacterium]|nr:O-antigen ligase family protein [Crocinitomicaceae bacterium]
MSFERLYLITLCLLTGMWILFPHFTSLLVCLFGLVVVYGILKKELVFTFQLLPSLLALLYIIYLVYAIPTNHLPIALDFLEYKLSLLVFPFLFSFQPKFRLDWKYVCYSFLLAVTVLVFFDLIQASVNYSNSGILNAFYSSALSPTHHPTYLTAFLSFAILLLLQLSWTSTFAKLKWGFYGIIGLFVLMHIPLSSLSGMLFLCLFFGLAMLIYYAKKKRWGLIIFIFCAGCVMGFSILRVQPSLKTNINNTVDLVASYAASPQKFIQSRPFPMQGNEARLVIWTVAFDIFLDHPMGVNLGNLEAMMHQRLVELGLNKQADLNYNPHNQFLQIAAELGIIGLLLFLGILLYGIVWAISSKNWLLLLVILSLAINCLFESMLQRQSGIVFYCFWICLLSSSMYKKELK